MRKFVTLFFFLSTVSLFSQDFFDSLEQKISSPAYELNGFVRGAFFAGQDVSSGEPEQKAGYGEFALKARVRKAEWGGGYAEVRFRDGLEFGQSLSELNVRESYVNVYFGRLDLRVGKQIVVWGRADGINPTNNITPQDMLIRSTAEDDRKMGNFLFRASYAFEPFRLQGIWTPQYRPSVLPIFLFPFPSYVSVADAENPSAQLRNSAVGLKLELELGAFDGSLSYFNGFMPLPGVTLKSIDIVGTEFSAVVAQKPYRMSIVGGDFSTSIASLGVRGEAAFRQPINDYKLDINVHIPNPDIQCVVGVDKSIGDFSLIVQYIGRYILDFSVLQPSGLPVDQLFITNRMITSQLHEFGQALMARLSMNFLYETLNAECLAYYDFTTQESLLRPILSYDVTDALTLKIGAEIYSGPENTLFGSIDKALSSGFFEMRASF